MGGAASSALLYTGGNVSALVIMYSINVFLTFSLSQLAMCRSGCASRAQRRAGRGTSPSTSSAFVLCLSILA